MEKFVWYLHTIKDRREIGKVQYTIPEIILLVIFALLGNAQDYEEFEIFGKANLEALRKYLPYRCGIPDESTIRFVLSMINPVYTNRLQKLWADILNKDEGRKIKELIINIDGKTMRGNKSKSQLPLHIVSAFSPNHGISFSQVATDEKSNEITAIPRLLNQISIEGSIVTIDAMGTQKEIAKQIVKNNKAGYVLAVKSNQPSLYQEIVSVFEDEVTLENLMNSDSYLRTEEKARSQTEIREYFLFSGVAGKAKTFPVLQNWEGVKSIGLVRSLSVKDGKETIEFRYFICTFENDIELFRRSVRGHWSVESMHWCLDVVFREDASKVLDKNASQNLNHLRKLSLGMLKILDMGKKMSLPKKRYALSMGMANYIDQIFEM